MKDNLSIFITMIVFVILVVIFPLYNHFERQDNMSYNLVLKATTNFVDEIMNNGYIDQDMYSKYVSQIANTGNLYDIQLEAHKKIITKDTEGESDDVYQDQYIIDYNDDIFESSTGEAKDSGKKLDDKSIKNGVYKLDIGDEIYIKLKNSNTTMAEAIFRTIVPLASSKHITVNYGGIVKNNAWLKAESGVISKELITLSLKIKPGRVEDLQKYLYYGDVDVAFDLTSINELVPTDTGERKGWREEGAEDDSEIYTENIIRVRRSMKLIPVIETATPTITFDVNGGDLLADDKKSVQLTAGETYGDKLPTPTYSGHEFEGWFTAEEGGKKVESGDPVGKNNQTLYAHWINNLSTVTLKLNGGKVEASEQTSKIVEYGKAYGTLPAPTKDGYEFKGWYYTDDSGNENEIKSTTPVKVRKDHDLVAKWSGSQVKVEYVLNGGTLPKSEATSKNVVFNSTYGSLPTPSRGYYTFEGWYTSSSGGTKITSDTKVTNSTDHKIYAQWKGKTITVTFNANGGVFNDGSNHTVLTHNYFYGDVYNFGFLGTGVITRSNCSFNGWYTLSSGGSEIKSGATKVTTPNNHTIYAHWKANSGYVLTKNNASNSYYVYQGYKGSVNINYHTTQRVQNNTVYKILETLVADEKTVYKIGDNEYILADACQ